MSTKQPPAPRFHARTWYRDAVGRPPALTPVSTVPRSVDTVVVGAGLAGLSTALELAESGNRDVLVVDRGAIGEGASGRNGGFVFAGYSLDPEALVRKLGEDPARRLHRWTREAVAKVRKRCRSTGVAVSDSEVILADWFGNDERLAALQRRLADRLDFHLEPIDRDELRRRVRSDRYGAGLLEPGSFHFNPLEYAHSIAAELIANGGAIATGAPVTAIRRRAGRWRVRTPGVEIDAARVVLATGGYERGLTRQQRSVQPIATYIVVTEPLGGRLEACLPSDHAFYDTRFAFDYYRKLPNGRLLWGGRISTADRDPGTVERIMRRDLARVFPELADCRFDYAWGGWMSYARHQMPVLGEFEPGLWLALGFGGHGMAPTALAGELLADAINGDDRRLQSFAAFGPVWAGGHAGRMAVQGVYWWKQMRDYLRR
jgi:glycine/D-amino acid oxidase-like deaminating enzyme